MKAMILGFLVATMANLAIAEVKPLYECTSEDGLTNLVVTATGKASGSLANTLKFRGYIPETINLECLAKAPTEENDDVVVICRGYRSTTIFEIQIHDNSYTWLPTAEGSVSVGGFAGAVRLGRLGQMTCPR